MIVDDCIAYILAANDEGDFRSARAALLDLRALIAGGGAALTRAQLGQLFGALAVFAKTCEGSLAVMQVSALRTKTY